MSNYLQDKHYPKKPTPFFKQAIEIYHNWYLEQFELPYSWAPKDFANLKSLLNRLKQVEGNPLDNLSLILSNLKEASPWHYDNISLPLLNSHYNQLLLKITQASKPRTWEQKEAFGTVDKKPRPMFRQYTQEELEEIEAVKKAYEQQKVKRNE